MPTTSDDAAEPRSEDTAANPDPIGAVPAPRSEQIDRGDLAHLLAALTSLRDGHSSVRAPRGAGMLGLLADRVNETAELSERRTRDLVRLSRVIGREGRMTERLHDGGSSGGGAAGAEAVHKVHA